MFNFNTMLRNTKNSLSKSNPLYKYLIALLLLVVISYGSFAQGFNTQEGWVVTHEGDTLHGLIKDLKDKREEILFKPHSSPAFKTYTPSDLKSFRYTGEYYYKTKELPGQDQATMPVFVLCLIEGPLSLYRDPDFFYAEKQAGTLHKLEQMNTMQESGKMLVDKRYINTLLHLTRECQNLQALIKDTRLHTAGLIKVVTAYNQCIDPPQGAQLTTKPTKVKLRIGVKLGTHVSNISYFQEGTSVRDYDFVQRIGYIGGAVFDLSYANKFSLRPEILITQKGASYQGFTTNVGEREIYTSLTTLHLPLSLYYTLPTQRLRPFILAGAALSYTISDKSYMISPTGRRGVDTGKQFFGFRAGGGLNYSFESGHSMNIEYVYDYAKTSGTFWRVKTQYVNHSITLGFGF